MKKFIVSGIFIIFFSFLQANEGMWIPSLIKMYYPQMQEAGMKLTPEQIYSINSSSLKDAVIHFNGGCTAELVSDKGLMLTNHHCGFGAIQSHSSVKHDYLKDGFWAKDFASELKNNGMTATRIVRIDDVTSEVMKEFTENMDEADRQVKIRLAILDIVEKAIENTHFEAEVESYDYGNSYYIIVKEVFKDIRLVGAPPTEIGKFGGDTDNWVWPRHTGDFSMFRIYVNKENKPAEYSDENIPYKPLHFFPISLLPKKEGDFTMVYGFPGRTEEYISSAKLKYIMETERPVRISMRDKTLGVINSAMKSSDELRIKYAAKQARIANAWKKWKGQLIGLTNINALQVKEDYEDKYLKRASSKTEWKKYADALASFSDLQRMYQSYDEAYVLYTEYLYYGYGPEYLKIAKIIKDLEASLSKDDFEKAKTKAINRVKGTFKNMDLATDRKIFEQLSPVFVAAISEEFLPLTFQKEGVMKVADKIYTSSILVDEQKCIDFIEKFSKKSFDKKMMKDPGYLLYQDCEDVFKTMLLENLRYYYTGSNQQMKIYLEGKFVMFPDLEHWPDANGTMRITWGKLEGSEPRDGMAYKPYTTLGGIYQKYMTGNPDFKISENFQNAIKKKDYGDYGQDGELWTCFSGSNHTTGGNSGSPMIDGEGNLIGINFDRSWESTMSDYMFDPKVCRNIAVDIRFVLWVIDKYAGATHLVKEMKLITPDEKKKQKNDRVSTEIRKITNELALEPDDFQNRLKRASLYFDLKLYTESLSDASICLRIQPKNDTTRLLKAKSLYYLEEYDKSLVELKKIIAKSRSFEESFYFAGKIRLMKGDIQMALKNFEIALKLNPDLENIYWDMGACYIALGKTNRACEYFISAEKKGENFVSNCEQKN